jgi:hypothetical protein
MKGGKTSGTWKSDSKWQHGQTQVIRVPALLVTEILKYAEWLDEHSKFSLAQNSQGNFSCDLILKAIDKYIKWRQYHHHPNQHSRKLNTSTRTWDELRKFRTMVETNLL